VVETYFFSGGRAVLHVSRRFIKGGMRRVPGGREGSRGENVTW